MQRQGAGREGGGISQVAHLPFSGRQRVLVTRLLPHSARESWIARCVLKSAVV